MAKYISLTAIGKDRPGLVSAVTKVLYKERCNIEDSTMTILHDQFAMILIIKVSTTISVKSLYKQTAKIFKTAGYGSFIFQVGFLLAEKSFAYKSIHYFYLRFRQNWYSL
ncbi:MAG: hypothetical protein LBD98_00315 [Endomicrobium sp.]|jgi:glycine cleavage system transcriptional repressor|nr:hypothetical protein [Endomicrobium sp.]